MHISTARVLHVSKDATKQVEVFTVGPCDGDELQPWLGKKVVCKYNSKLGKRGKMEQSALSKIASHRRIVHWLVNEGPRMYLEYYPDGDLEHCQRPLSSQMAKRWTRQIAEALAYLHAPPYRAAHLDISPKNVLITNNGQDIVLADFEFLHQADRGVGDSISKHRGTRGTPLYTAPEMIQSAAVYLRTDIWSLGVLSLAMLLKKNKVIWEGEENAKRVIDLLCIVQKGVDGMIIPKGMDMEHYDFVDSLLVVDPLKRPTAQEVLQHCWLLHV